MLDHIDGLLDDVSRRWIQGAGVGHVFESKDGGATFTDITGNLPDSPVTDLLITPSGKLVVGTDVGVFDGSEASPGSWARYGGGLPNSIIDDLSFGSTGTYIIAATHGRGLWKIATP